MSDGTASDSQSFTWTIEQLPNLAPNANAGTVDQTIILPASANLQGSASDDGLPNPPGAVSSSWSMVSGPGSVTFADANAMETTASFSTHGNYILRLTVNDGQLSDTDDVTIIVESAPIPNVAPNANAGSDQTIMLPSSVTLQGSASDDGLPNPPGAVSANWSKVSGPGSVTFADASALITSVSFSTDGNYILRLTVNDSQLSDSDDVAITVEPAPIPNVAPNANAGSDQTVILPSSITLQGGASDDGLPNPPGAVSASWSNGERPRFGDLCRCKRADYDGQFFNQW